MLPLSLRRRQACAAAALAGLLACGGLAGCGRGSGPPATGAQPPGAPPTEPPLLEVSALTAQGSTSFRVRAERRSLAVVEHYNQLFADRGWKKEKPKLVELPGQRQWLPTGASIGPTEAYDAAWKDPQSGEVAVLSLWHTAEAPEVQNGTLDFYPADRAPL